MREWLTARPIAHRGLHDAAAGVIENTASAFRAAVTGGYGIECDLQASADGEAMVYHDETLGRLTDGDGRLDRMPAAALKCIAFKATADRMLALGELCDLVAGRATLLLELKSRFDGDQRLARRTATVLAGYRGPVAAMSFDPAPVAAWSRSGAWRATATARTPRLCAMPGRCCSRARSSSPTGCRICRRRCRCLRVTRCDGRCSLGPYARRRTAPVPRVSPTR